MYSCHCRPALRVHRREASAAKETSHFNRGLQEPLICSRQWTSGAGGQGRTNDSICLIESILIVKTREPSWPIRKTSTSKNCSPYEMYDSLAGAGRDQNQSAGRVVHKVYTNATITGPGIEHSTASIPFRALNPIVPNTLLAISRARATCPFVSSRATSSKSASFHGLARSGSRGPLVCYTDVTSFIDWSLYSTEYQGIESLKNESGFPRLTSPCS